MKTGPSRCAPVVLGLCILLGAPGARTSGADAESALRPPPTLLFRAAFDDGSADAEFAAGDPNASLGRPLGREKGVADRGGALLLQAGEDCAYAMRGNLELRAGTLSFWARAHGWRDGEGRSQTLFRANGSSGGRPFSFYVDSPPEAGVVRLVIAFGGGRDPHQKLFQITAPADWSSGWQKLDVTWDERQVLLYANGEIGERIPLETVSLPALEGGRFVLAPVASLGPGAADATRIDEVEIWNAALPADRIRKRFRAATEPSLEPASLRAPRWSGGEMAIDGRLDEPGWARATRVPLLPDAETGFAGLLVPHAALAWDERALHVAIEAARTDLAPGAREDAFELVIAGGGTSRTVRVTPGGLAGPDPQSGIRVATDRRAAAWTAELSVPFAALGITLPRPGEILGLDVRHLPALPGALAVGARLSAGEGLSRIVLGGEEEGARVTGSAALGLGRLQLGFERAKGGRAELSLDRAGRRLWSAKKSFETRESFQEALPDPAGGVVNLRVRDRDGEEIVALSTRIAALDVPGLVAVPEPDARRLAVELDLGWVDGSLGNALAAGTAQVELEDHGPAGLEGPLQVTLERGSARVPLAAGLAAGRHELTLRLRPASDAEPVELSRVVEVPPLPWLGSRAGETEGVLDPWLPLGWDGDATVRVWGRRYQFAGPLLASVEREGRAMLRAPMQLRLRTATGDATLRTTRSEVTARSAARAEFRGEGTFEGADLDVEWSAWIEYDGLVVSRVTLLPRRPGLRIDELALEIPLRSDLVRYLRGTTQRSQIQRGRVAWNGRRFETIFEPFVWVTNEDEGFLYFAESDANWVGAERPGAVVVKGGPEAGISLRLIDGPASVPGPLSYQLGFQATPVKPLMSDRRAWNFGSAWKLTEHQTVAPYFVGAGVADGLWEISRPKAVAENDDSYRARGVRLFYFATSSSTPDYLPTFVLFERLWRSAFSTSFSGVTAPESALRDAVPRHRLAAVCPGDPSYQDRMLHDAESLLRASDGLGVYTDTDSVFADDNPRHGCGFVDAFGRRGVSWTILKKRRMAKRLAAILRSVGGERRYWMSHAHSRLVPPVHGFADFWFPGEELTHYLAKNPWYYVEGLAEQAWRAEYRSEASGIVHVFLPEFGRGIGKREHEERQPTESLLAMAAVNDISVSSAYASREAVGEYWGLRGRLGLVDADFVAYWRSDCPVRALDEYGRASLYRTKRGPVLVVANRDPSEGRIDIQLDLEQLGIAGVLRARDERTGRELAVQGNRLSVTVDPRSYTYVSFE